jgi:hypothetical protein
MGQASRESARDPRAPSKRGTSTSKKPTTLSMGTWTAGGGGLGAPAAGDEDRLGLNYEGRPSTPSQAEG